MDTVCMPRRCHLSGIAAETVEIIEATGERRSMLVVTRLEPGGAALESGQIHVNDRIIYINDTCVIGMPNEV